MRCLLPFLEREKKTGLLARCDGPFSGPGDDITIELHGRSPNLVSRVVLKNGEKPAHLQTLRLKIEPIIDLETVGVLFTDFNFDGFENLALMKFLPAGPNVPYVYYLYDQGKQKFKRFEALEDLTSPDVKPAEKRIHSYWRNSAAESGYDIYKWKGRNLMLERRVEDNYASGTCVWKILDPVGDGFVLKSEGACE